MINKFGFFKELLNSLDANFKLIGLTETWLKDFNEVNFELLNYDYIGSHRGNEKGGGVGLYIAKQLRYKIRKDLKTEIEGTIETIFIEIKRDSGKNIIIGVVYRPPNKKLEIFQNEINKIIGKMEKENKISYLMGDFNIDLLKSESSEHANNFAEQLFTSSVIPLITKPTRITSHTATLIDNNFTNNINNVDKVVNGIILIYQTIIAHMCKLDRINNFNKQTQNKSRYQRIINKQNISYFTNEIRNMSWENILNNSNPANAFDEFSKSFTEIHEKNFPHSKKTSNKFKINKIKSPWMTKECIKIGNKEKQTL